MLAKDKLPNTVSIHTAAKNWCGSACCTAAASHCHVLLPLLPLLFLLLQPDVAVKLLSAASRRYADAPEVWYYLGTALGKQGGQDGSCCICFLRTLQLLGPQPEGQVRAALAGWLAVAACGSAFLMFG